MTIQHESRNSTDRRKNNLYSRSAALTDRRWHSDRRSPMIDDDSLYDPDWEVSDSDLEAYAKISLDD
jgi:hypothetical protein